jgi:hypothetical protein
LETYWDEPLPITNTFEIGGRDPFALVTHVEAVSEGKKLVNSEYMAHIDERGSLVAEQVAAENPKEIWKSEIDPNRYQSDWVKAFLVLESNGLLKLIHQVTGLKPGMDPVDHSVIADGPVPIGQNWFDFNTTLCRVTGVWNSSAFGVDHNSYSLVLGSDGNLMVNDKISNQMVWSNRPVDISSEEQQAILEEDPSSCITSGNATLTIVEALSHGPGSEAILCQGGVFEISSTIKMNVNGQKIYTEGFPNDER